MRLLLTILVMLWATACLGIYVLTPAWAGWDGGWAGFWYGFGWIAVGALFVTPLYVYDHLGKTS